MLPSVSLPARALIRTESGGNWISVPFLVWCKLLMTVLFSGPVSLSAEISACEYPVYFYSRSAEVEVDGKADEPLWNYCHVETGFSFPWDSREAPATSFKAFLDTEHLYLFFSSYDTTLLDLQGEGEEWVARGDRVEVFFALDAALSKYFCLEISPSARVLDYEASYYRKFRSEWDLAGLRVSTLRSFQYYSVEAAIPLATLEELGVPKPNRGRWIRIGLFRADFVQKSTGVEQNWISWCRPAVKQPDFHVPSAFGFFRVLPSE